MTKVAPTAAPPEATLRRPDGGQIRPALRTFLHVFFPLMAGLLDLPLVQVWQDPVDRTGAPVPDLLPTLAVVAMVVMLLLRRRASFQVLLGTLVSWTLVVWIDGAQPLSCVLVATYAAASCAGRTLALPVLGLAFLHSAVVTASALLTYGGEATTGEILAPAIAFAIIAFTAWGFGRVEAERTARTQVLADELARATVATLAERQRIARELHDILAHSVSAMMMQAAGARAVAGSVADAQGDERLRPVVAALGNIETTGSQSLRELHRLLGVMRETATTSSLDLDTELNGSSSSQPGLDDLDELIQTPRASGLIVELHRTGHPPRRHRPARSA